MSTTHCPSFLTLTPTPHRPLLFLPIHPSLHSFVLPFLSSSALNVEIISTLEAWNEVEAVLYWVHLLLRSSSIEAGLFFVQLDLSLTLLLLLWHKINYKNEHIFEYVQECENELWNFNGNLSFVEIYTIKLGEYMMKYEDIQIYMDFQLLNHYCSSVKHLYCNQLEPFHNSLSHYWTYPKMYLFL